MGFKRTRSLLKRIRYRIRANYQVFAYKFWIFPQTNSVKQREVYDSRSLDYDFYDFHPLPHDSATVHVIWAVDFITPSISESVKRKIAAIPWRRLVAGSENPLEWVESTRGINNSGWQNLGFVGRADSQFFDTKISKLPDNFRSARFTLFSVTPSLSAIVGCFYLQNDQKRKYDEIARLHLWPEAIPHRQGSITINDPRHRKENILSEQRISWRNEISKFYREIFGTLFSIRNSDYLTTVDLIEFTSSNCPRMRDFLIRHGETWRSDETILKWLSPYGETVPRRHSSAFYFGPEMENVDLSLYGSDDVNALVAKMSHTIERNWIFEALNSYILFAESSVSSFRDAEFRPIVSFSNERAFRKENNYFDLSDIALIIAELKRSNLKRRAKEVIDYRKSRNYEFYEPLSERLIKSIEIKAKRIGRQLEKVQQFRDTSDARYSLLYMARLGRYSLFLATITLAASIVAIIVAFGGSE